MSTNRTKADKGAFRGAAAMLLTMLALARPAAAATLEDLYQAQTIVTGQGEPNRIVGFARCLVDVLVKVSGDPRLIGDTRLAALTDRAATMVTDFSYHDRMSGIPVHDEQGTRDRPYDLTVTFDPGKIDAAVRSLGLSPWAASRPRLVAFVGMRNGAVTNMLTGDGDRVRDQRDGLLAAAGKRGMPVALPSASALAAAGLDFARLPQADMARLDALARQSGGDLALAGRLVWEDRTLGWTADWRLAWQGATHRWRIAGASFDDAFRNAMEGALQILSGHGKPKG
jgi:hypothetical protein